MRLTRLFVPLLLIGWTSSAVAQTGPWARYDAKMKGEALVRDADGGSLREVESIVEGGGDVNWRVEPSGLTPLMAAASGGHAKVVAFLLAHGAKTSLTDRNGRTALDRARMGGSQDVVRLLAGAMPAVVPTPAPATPAAPVATPATPVATPVAAPGAWAPFGAYKAGDRVLFFAGSWKNGTVREVGIAGDRGQKSARPMERKYLVATDAYANAGDWTDWGLVAGRVREPFWTGFFVGDWSLGETFAVNTRVRGAEQQDVYSFGAATEALRVNANGTYEWKQPRAATIRGRWTPAPDGPGIVLQKGARDRDWTLRNETNAVTENIRGLQTARLTTPGIMSVAAKRPLK